MVCPFGGGGRNRVEKKTKFDERIHSLELTVRACK